MENENNIYYNSKRLTDIMRANNDHNDYHDRRPCYAENTKNPNCNSTEYCMIEEMQYSNQYYLNEHFHNNDMNNFDCYQSNELLHEPVFEIESLESTKNVQGHFNYDMDMTAFNKTG